MGQLCHVHHPLPAQHLGHALAPQICQQGPTVRNLWVMGWGEATGPDSSQLKGAQWSRWGSYRQQLGNRPPVLRQVRPKRVWGGGVRMLSRKLLLEKEPLK
ncbi:hypothetical protein MC885_018611 [Smutsia gigantea]|nr:hypothetical protein MC885_018611 [Smutsia gigantea]